MYVITLRNRRFLRKFQIRSPVVQNLGSGAVKDGLSTVQNPIVKDSAQPQKKISAQQSSSIPLSTQTLLPDTQTFPKPSPEIEHDKLEQQGFNDDGLQSPEQSPEFNEQPVPRNEQVMQQPESRPRGRPPKSYGVKESTLPVQPEPSRRSTRVQNQRKLYDASSGQYVNPTEWSVNISCVIRTHSQLLSWWGMLGHCLAHLLWDLVSTPVILP